jgi:hypothetical protein
LIPLGDISSKPIGLPWTADAGHLAVVGPTRSGKGLHLTDTLIRWPGPVVCVDPKGEQWQRTAGFRQQAYGPVYRIPPQALDLGELYDLQQDLDARELSIGEPVTVFGFPHADLGRTVLTYQPATVGARVLETSPAGVQTKMAILNVLTRPGQSGGPVISVSDASVLGVVVGPFVPAGGGGVIVGGVDPAALNQTTHVVSAEYLREMLNDVPA